MNLLQAHNLVSFLDYITSYRDWALSYNNCVAQLTCQSLGTLIWIMVFFTFCIYFHAIFASCSPRKGSHPSSLMLFTVHTKATTLSEVVAVWIIGVAYVTGIIGVIRATRAVKLDMVSIIAQTICTSEIGSIYGTWVVVGAASRGAAPCPFSPDFSSSNASA